MIVKGGTLPDGTKGGCRHSRRPPSRRWSPKIEAETGQVVDASGCRRLATPLRSTRISTWMRRSPTASPRINESGTLLEGIGLWGELKPLLTHEAVKERAACLLRLGRPRWACSPSVRMSTPATTGCWPQRRCWKSRRRWRVTSTCSFVAFPQDGFYRAATAPRKHHPRARHWASEVVGGIPHFERTMADGNALGDRTLRDRGGTRPCASTCIATRPTIRCRAISSSSPMRRSGSACRAASTART